MANQSNGRLWFEAGIDRSQLSRGVTAINKDFSGLQGNAARTGMAFSDMWRTAAAGVGTYLTATAALDMGQQIIDLTRQRELMEKSFEVMLGGADAAAKKIQEINEYAILSPYTFDGVAKGVQTMSAFGIATDDLMPTLRMLGDVAAGNQQRFESLSLVYGQIQSAGRLMGQDLLQLINAGFNPLQIISAQTGQSMLELKKQMESGLISFDMVADAFKSATSEGGKFYGMTTKMADSIEAAKSTFESAWVEKQIEWGKAASENVMTMYEFGTTVVGEADNIAKAFGVLIAAVGSYKAALIAMSVTQTAVAAAGNVKAFLSLARGIKSAKDAMLLFNIATKANPVGIIISALAIATTAFFAFRKEVEDTAESLSATEQIAVDYTAQLEDEKNKIERLNRVMRDSTAPMQQRLRALKDLQTIIPDYNVELSKEGGIINDNTTAIEEYIKAKEREIKLKIYESQLTELYKQQIQQEEALDTAVRTPLPDAMDNAAYAEILKKQKESSVAIAQAVLAQTNAEIADIQAKIGLEDGADATNNRVGLSPEQKKALKAEAEARRKMYEQGLRDYETFQQGVERLAKEHADRVAAYEKEATSPEQLTQLTTGSEDQMNAEIEALHEKHRTEEYQNKELAAKEKAAQLKLLQEYGTFEQRKFEIRRRYAKKIEETEGGSQKQLLTNQMNAEVASVESEALSADIDWQLILGEFGGVMNAVIEPELQRLKSYMDTEEFKAASAESKQVLVDAIAQLEESLGGGAELNFKQLGIDVSNYQKALREKNEATLAEIEAQKALSSAQAAYDSALKKGTEDQIKNAKKQLDAAEENAEQAATNVTTATTAATVAANTVKGTATLLDDNLNSMVSGLQAITSGSLKGVLDGIDEFGKMGGKFGEAFSKFSDKLDKVPIIGWIVAIIDVFREGLSDVIGGLIDAILGAVGGILTDILTADFIQAIGEALWNGLLEIANALTSGIFNLGGAERKAIKETAKLQAQYDRDALLGQYAINAQYRERYEWAKKIGETEIENLKRQIAEAKKQINSTQSEESELLKKLQGSEYITGYSTKRTGWFKQKRETVENTASLEGMSYDQILELEAQGKLTEEAQEYLDALRASKEEGEDLADTLIEAQEALREAVVGMGFDEVVNHAMDDLLDGTKTAAEAFDEIMQGAMTKMLKEMMNEDVRDWYEGFAAAGTDGYTQAEKEYWKARWEDIQRKNEQAKEDVEDITGESFDTGTQGQADANAITAIQEEAPGSIDGKLTALQISSTQTAANTTLIAADTSMLRASVVQMRDGMDTLNNNVRHLYSEAKLIREYTAELPAMAKDIKKVVTNTNNL